MCAHVSVVVHGAAEDERPFEGHEQVVGEGVDVDALEASVLVDGFVEDRGEVRAPGDDGLADVRGGRALDELALGEKRDEEAAGLRAHQLVGRPLEDAHERDHAFCGVVCGGLGLGDGAVELFDIRSGVAGDERAR